MVIIVNLDDVNLLGNLAEKMNCENLESLTFNFDGVIVTLGTTLKVPRERPLMPLAHVDIHVKEPSGHENRGFICFDRDKQVFLNILTDYLKDGHTKKYSEEEHIKFGEYKNTMSEAYRTLLKNGYIGQELVDRPKN